MSYVRNPKEAVLLLIKPYFSGKLENMNIDYPKLLASIAYPFVAGAVGSYFTTPAIQFWYNGLTKPVFSPPNWVFGPVWSFLYLLMGISLYLVWNTPVKKNKQQNDLKKAKKDALTYFGLQLVLNTIWSILFFGIKSPELALAGILILWMAIFWTIRKFYTVSPLASYLLYPYLAWVSFATLLNLFIVRLN